MENKHYLYIIFILLFNFKANSQITNSDTLIEKAYQPGEKLIFDVKYGIVRGGEATCEVNLIPYGFFYAYHFITILQTTGLAEKVADIRDVYESYVEVGTDLPVKATRNAIENNYKSYNEVTFKRDSNLIFSSNHGYFNNAPDSVMDIIAAFYYARNYMFSNVNEIDYIELPLYHDKEILMLKMHFVKTEEVKTEFGVLNTKLFTPVIESAEFFTQEDDLKIWVSDDKNHLPLKMVAKTPIGKLRIILKEYTGLKHELMPVKEIEEELKISERKSFIKRAFKFLRKN